MWQCGKAKVAASIGRNKLHDRQLCDDSKRASGATIGIANAVANLLQMGNMQ